MEPIEGIESGPLGRVQGIRVGHAADLKALTGCTVILCDGGAVAAVDVRGGAPGSRELALLRPGMLVRKIHALFLTGGSAFGLDAAGGVMRYLEERGVGHPTSYGVVPIVPSAVIYDLNVGDARRRPDPAMAYEAAASASADEAGEGNVGAGAGATVGKILGIENATKAGLGTAILKLSGDFVLGALAVVNAVGDIYDPVTGHILAGARDPVTGGFVDTIRFVREQIAFIPPMGESTTLAVIVTNANFDGAELGVIAAMAHDGLARVIRPVHTRHDGDAVFALSTGKIRGLDVNIAGALAAELVAWAIRRAVEMAEGLAGIPSARDLRASP
jgi:L-aminopeptidase/D-esterase-like protein